MAKIGKGQHFSPNTEFKKGQHWRPKQPFWEKTWLVQNYVLKQRSAKDIADEFGITEGAITFWLKKHGIPRRSISEARDVKHWGLAGKTNGMYGKTGDQNPRWLGGVSKERQTVYSSQEWAKAVKTVWKRDRAVCQRCKRHASVAKVMHIHHIVSFAEADLRCEPANLVLLCGVCHRWVHSRKNVNGEFIKERRADNGT